jgi:hypothetical protein
VHFTSSLRLAVDADVASACLGARMYRGLDARLDSEPVNPSVHVMSPECLHRCLLALLEPIPGPSGHSGRKEHDTMIAAASDIHGST